MQQASLNSIDGDWSEAYITPRYYHSAIYDPVRDRMVVFGGDDGAYSGWRNDVWALSLAGIPQWAKLEPAGIPPGGRYGHTVVYDPVRDRILLFGGVTGSPSDNHWVNDTWALSLAGSSAWSHLAPAGTLPSPRGFHSAIYDPVRDRMLIFGGDDGTRRNDLWALSLAGSPAWSTIVPSGIAPSERAWQAAIYDPVRDRMVIFGGLDGTPYPGPYQLNDAWAVSLEGSPSWSLLAPTGTPPSGRSKHTAVYDPVRDRMLVFGGQTSSTPYYLNDLWALSLAGDASWSQITPTGMLPSGRYAHAAAYDPVRDQMVVFGGYDNYTRNDTWGLSLAGSPAWNAVVPAVSPGGGYAAIYDPVRDRVVAFGTSGSNDTWALSLSGSPVWTRLTPSGTLPRARSGHTAIYDPVRDRMLVFGGATNSSPYYVNDVWALSLSGNPTWYQIVVGPSPSARYYHTAIYDPVRDRMVIFGGNAGTNRNDTWALSLSGSPVWTQLAPTGGPPGGRSNHTAVYDPARDRMVVFGGDGGVSSEGDDTWALSFAGPLTWSLLTPSGTPPSGRFWHTAIYEPVRDRMVVFGGYSGSFPYILNDAWALSLAGGTAWTQLSPEGIPPRGRYNHTAVYDPVRDRMMVYGGYAAPPDLFALTWGTPVGVPGVPSPRAAGFEFAPPHPNPSSGEVTLDFALPIRAAVSIVVYDLAGRVVRRVADGAFGPGHCSLVWSGEDGGGSQVPSGMYFARLHAAGQVITRKAVLTH